MLSAIDSNVYNSVEELSSKFLMGVPFPHVVIDNFLVRSLADALVNEFPDVNLMHRSHHYLFANKYELASWSTLSKSFGLLYQELISPKFQSFICQVANANIFIDPDVHGDLHQGVNGSFLDMHVDFNVHPYRANWLHYLNIIIYLNKDWEESYGGSLQLKGRLEEELHEIAPLFNRCAIVKSDDTTYHGYRQLRIPQGITRKSILIHFYKEESPKRMPIKQPTIFVPDRASTLKSSLAKLYNPITTLKRQVWGVFKAR
jgi:hypothetical protein